MWVNVRTASAPSSNEYPQPMKNEKKEKKERKKRKKKKNKNLNANLKVILLQVDIEFHEDKHFMTSNSSETVLYTYLMKQRSNKKCV